MSRYINSADALNTLKRLAYETALNQHDLYVADVFEDIAKNRLETWVDLIPTADAVETPMWIPVSERLPNDDEEGMDVLVSIKNASYSDYVETARFLYKNWWYADIDEEMDKEMAKCVIAWMPLPEPYREETEND